MKKLAMISTLFTLVLYISVACSTKPVKNESVSTGRISNGKYINEFLGFQIDLPKSYQSIEERELKSINNNIKSSAAAENEFEQKSIDLTELIFGIHFFDQDTLTTAMVNPTLFITTERLDGHTRSMDAKDYMKFFRTMHAREKLDWPATVDEVATVEIDGEIFERHTIIQKGVRIDLKTGQYCKIIGDYAVIFSILYGTKQDRHKLINLLSTFERI